MKTVYSNEHGTWATRDRHENGFTWTEWAVPDGKGGIQWVANSSPLAAPDEPVMTLLDLVWAA